MLKIYDCSNLSERPQNRGNGCPFQNDIIRYLKENSYRYDCQFVDSPSICDIIITNDVFPKQIQEINKSKIKRMDGIYWDYKYLSRNESLNQSAQIADHVIFISEFSRDSYFKLYGNPLNSYSICLNQADPNIFYKQENVEELVFIATASSWIREEKRMSDIVKLAEVIEERIILIGHPPEDIKLPSNMISIGYLDNPKEIAKALNSASAFINFSYRDAAPKTVCQALCCGLPVLYAYSGGVPEIVESYGVGIEDIIRSSFESKTPDLDVEPIRIGYKLFKNNFHKLREDVKLRKNEEKFKNMLDDYFGTIIKFA